LRTRTEANLAALVRIANVGMLVAASALHEPSWTVELTTSSHRRYELSVKSTVEAHKTQLLHTAPKNYRIRQILPYPTSAVIRNFFKECLPSLPVWPLEFESG
jgi:hypothetical protein